MSGMRADRPQLARAIAALDRGDVLAVVRIDRLGLIDIHCIQIIAAARWMKPVKLTVRLS
jgi:DNA invertase Pin-like site-specific DNA recombinase